MEASTPKILTKKVGLKGKTGERKSSVHLRPIRGKVPHTARPKVQKDETRETNEQVDRKKRNNRRSPVKARMSNDATVETDIREQNSVEIKESEDSAIDGIIENGEYIDDREIDNHEGCDDTFLNGQCDPFQNGKDVFQHSKDALQTGYQASLPHLKSTMKMMDEAFGKLGNYVSDNACPGAGGGQGGVRTDEGEYSYKT